MEYFPRKNLADNILSVIFTFNRAKYLWNIVNSHRINALNIPLLIIDDNSTDPDQVSTLEKLQKLDGIKIISGSSSINRHGGLYANMNMAMDIAYNNGYQFLNLLQDDMQIVRPAFEEIQHACALLENTTDALQVSLTFRKYLDVKNEPKPSAMSHLYRAQTLHASDTGIIHVERANELGFTFQDSERKHSDKAKSLGLTTYLFRDPVFAFVPWPVYFRNRKIGSRRRLKSLPGNKIQSIRTMSQPEIRALKDRDMSLLPYMEDWCRPSDGCWLAPYNYNNSIQDWSKRIMYSIANGYAKRRHIPHIICANKPVKNIG